MNYSVKKWQIARGTNLMTGNLGFANTAVTKLNGFDTYNGGNQTTYLDNVYIYNRAVFVTHDVQPTTLTANWVMYGNTPSPATQRFDIVVTAGLGQPAFTITTNGSRPWVTVNPGAGTLTNGTNAITLNFSTNALNVGVQTAILDVVAGIGAGVTDQVTVVVRSVSRPVPALSWLNYSTTIHKGFQPVATNLIISNTGAAPRSGMRYNVTSDSPAWLSAAPNGVCTDGEGHTIIVQFADMTTNVGSYDGILTIQTVDTNTTTLYTPVGTISSTMYVNCHIRIIGVGVPTGLTASDGTDTGGVQLNWVATTNVDHYEVWRASTNSLAAAALAGTATNITYYDTAINPGLKRWYWVRAINSFGGDGNFSASDLGWRYLPAPTGLTATSGASTNHVALSWAGSFGAVRYDIWRGIYTNISLAFSIASNVSAAATTYEDTTGDALMVYYYWVRAHTPDMYNDSALASGYRAALLTPASISASKGTFDAKIRVLWQAVDAATKYEIWRSADNNVHNAARIGTVTILGYDDTAASTSQVFYYWIKAHNAQGYASPFSETDYGWLQLATPANVAATQGTRPYSVRISWNAVENATSYEVVRSASPSLTALAQSLAKSMPLAAGAPSLGAGILSLGETTRTFFDDNATFAGASYLYGVRAKNARGNSELGGEAVGWRQVRQATTTKYVANDYDGDKLADVVLFNPDNGLWRILCTTLGEIPAFFGDATCVPVQGDYDGDRLADPMVYSATQGYWRVLLSLLNYTPPIQGAFGGPLQLAAAADYDGDQKTDPATYDAEAGMFTIMLSKSGYLPPVQMPLGGSGYVVASADYDGDGKADPAAYSATDGLLRIRRSNFEYDEVVVPLGGAGMIVVPGDFDGDNKSELTTYNEATGTLSVKLSLTDYGVQVNVPLGGPGYTWIMPSDYDGDGSLDPAAYSQANGWMIMLSRLGYATVSDTFGGTNNVPFVP